jgi:ABC-type transporter Mla MlaB component
MLRITSDQTHLKLEGRLVGPWVTLLRRECRSRPNVALDLSEVVFVDSAGVSLLARLVARGAQLRAASPFIAELLKSRTAQ